MNLPAFRWLEQRLFAETLPDIPAATRAELRRVLPRLEPGARIAVTAGSRGVANIGLILRAVCDEIRAAGGDPFLVPAMGTHGGATAAGQTALLAGLGVTQESAGAPILSSMDVVVLGHTAGGVEVYMDRLAAEADGVVVVERIKPHTDYTGDWESGLVKMMAIGLGKQAGAIRIHTLGATGLREVIPKVAAVTLGTGRILAGLAILENGLGETWRVVGVPPQEIMATEPRLLAQVKEHTPGLPFPEADLLIVDYVGKDVSGTGMDTKVIGRMRIAGEPEPARPRVRCLAALDLTAASHGNANGVGLADITTTRLTGKLDPEPLRVNALASGFWERSKVPVAVPSDREAIETGLRFAARPPEETRVCRMRDTACLRHLVVSEALLPALDGDVEVGPPYEMQFDAQGDLADHEHFGRRA